MESGPFAVRIRRRSSSSTSRRPIEGGRARSPSPGRRASGRYHGEDPARRHRRAADPAGRPGRQREGRGIRRREPLSDRPPFAPHPRYRVEGRDIHIDVPVVPWEAALGATGPRCRPPGGEVKVQGSARILERPPPPAPRQGHAQHPQAGRETRTPRCASLVLRSPSERERELFEELARASTFNPRGRPHDRAPLARPARLRLEALSGPPPGPFDVPSPTVSLGLDGRGVGRSRGELLVPLRRAGPSGGTDPAGLHAGPLAQLYPRSALVLDLLDRIDRLEAELRRSSHDDTWRVTMEDGSTDRQESQEALQEAQTKAIKVGPHRGGRRAPSAGPARAAGGPRSRGSSRASASTSSDARRRWSQSSSRRPRTTGPGAAPGPGVPHPAPGSPFSTPPSRRPSA